MKISRAQSYIGVEAVIMEERKIQSIFGIFTKKNNVVTRQLASDIVYFDKSEAERRCESLNQTSAKFIGITEFSYTVEKLQVV